MTKQQLEQQARQFGRLARSSAIAGKEHLAAHFRSEQVRCLAEAEQRKANRYRNVVVSA